MEREREKPEDCMNAKMLRRKRKEKLRGKEIREKSDREILFKKKKLLLSDNFFNISKKKRKENFI